MLPREGGETESVKSEEEIQRQVFEKMCKDNVDFGLYPKGNGKPLSYREVEELSILTCVFRILTAMWKI